HRRDFLMDRSGKGASRRSTRPGAWAAATDPAAACRPSRHSAGRATTSRRKKEARATGTRGTSNAGSFQPLLPEGDLLTDARRRRTALARPRVHRRLKRQYFIDFLGELGLDLLQFAQGKRIERNP